MPFKRGDPRPAGAGRQKGKLGNLNRTVKERVAEWGGDVFRVLYDAAMGELPCSVCRGKGKTKFQPAQGLERLSERTCQSCYGSGREVLSPKDRISAAEYLGRRLEPDLKAVELSNPDGSMKPPGWAVFFVGDEKKEPTQ